MSMSNTTRNRTELLRTAVPLSAGEKPFPALGASSVKEKMCAAFSSTLITTKTGLFTIKNRLKNLFTKRAFSFFNLASSNSSFIKASTLIATESLVTKLGFFGVKFFSAVKAIYPSFRNFLSAMGMHFGVFLPTHNLKIFNSIVGLNSINMVNTFTGFKFTAKVFFHHISVFKHLWTLPIFISRIMTNVYQNITSIKSSAALPVVMLFTSFSTIPFFHRNYLRLEWSI